MKRIQGGRGAPTRAKITRVAASVVGCNDAPQAFGTENDLVSWGRGGEGGANLHPNCE